jgi:hypothetical protein
MTIQTLIPRIVLVLILIGVCAFSYIESAYYHQHSLAVGEKTNAVSHWMWMYRSIALVAGIGSIIIVVSVIKK